MKDHLKSELTAAMKAKDKVRLSTLRSLLSAFQYEEMNKGVDELPEETTLAILKNELKKRKESLEFAEKANRTEDIDELKREMVIIEAFLPKQLTEDEIRAIITTMKGANPELSLGDVMRHLKEEFAGCYDGKLASSIIRSELT